MGAAARCALLVLTGLTAVAAQEPDAVRNERLLRQFLAAAFSDLAGYQVEVFGSDTPPFYYPEFIGARLIPPGEPRPAQRETTSSDDAAFLKVLATIEEGRIESAYLFGRYVNEPRTRELADLDFNGRLETPAQRLSALETRGARYGPDTQPAFERTLDLARLEPVMGRIEKFRTEFVWDDFSNSDTPEWMVRVRARQPGGRVVCYRMTHEVWEGHLTSVSSWTMAPGVQPGFTPDCMVP